MDPRTQDAIERLQRDPNFALYTKYIEERRETYLNFIINIPAGDSILISQRQGEIMALNEVLNIPELAIDYKRTRINES